MEITPELYESWNQKKQELQFAKTKWKLVHPGEFWICNIGVNIGSEISKDEYFQRPVLVLGTHLWWDMIMVVPCSKQHREWPLSQYYIPFPEFADYGLNQHTYFVMNQVKLMSRKRLVKLINNISKHGRDIPILPMSKRNELLEIYYQIIKKSSLWKLDL
jgi:mRNA-degrading endonuclease toxin of MazEF toxin-antitoxin module